MVLRKDIEKSNDLNKNKINLNHKYHINELNIKKTNPIQRLGSGILLQDLENETTKLISTMKTNQLVKKNLNINDRNNINKDRNDNILNKTKMTIEIMESSEDNDDNDSDMISNCNSSRSLYPLDLNNIQQTESNINNIKSIEKLKLNKIDHKINQFDPILAPRENKIIIKSIPNENIAATKIQKIVRGKLARNILKKLQNKNKKNENQLSDWQEVKDIENNEIWYVNLKTGESQWEIPNELKIAICYNTNDNSTNNINLSKNISIPIIHKKVEIKNHLKNDIKNDLLNEFYLPPLSPTSSGCSTPQKLSSFSPRSHLNKKENINTFSNININDTIVDKQNNIKKIDSNVYLSDSNNDINNKIINEISNNNNNNNNDHNEDMYFKNNFFLPDGTRNSKLRETIKEALKVSRFDSISTLLAFSNKENKLFNKKYINNDTRTEGMDLSKPPVRRSYSNHEVKVGKVPDKYLVSVLSTSSTSLVKKINKNKNKNSKINLLTSSKRSSHFTPLTIKELPADGLEIIENNNNNDNLDMLKDRNVIELNNNKNLNSNDICFACWCANKGQKCESHLENLNKNNLIKSSESSMMCCNWESDQLRRKYRAEEIHEIFMKSNKQLKYDKKLKKFININESSHPIYKYLNLIIKNLNKTCKRKWHIKNWFRSFIEQLSYNKNLIQNNNNQSKINMISNILKLKNTTQNMKWCQEYTNSIFSFLPKPPIVLKRSKNKNETNELKLKDIIYIDPNKPSNMDLWILYVEPLKPMECNKPRKYNIPLKKLVPILKPNFLTTIPILTGNYYINPIHKISWFERFVSSFSINCINKTNTYLKSIQNRNKKRQKVDQMDKNEKMNEFVITSVVFGTFGKISTPGNIAIGGLSSQVVLHILLTTYVPPQFGDFMITERRSTCPDPMKDFSANYVNLIIEIKPLGFNIARSLEHALNTRKPPTIIVTCVYEAKNNKQYHGLNRPEQTGEMEYQGFRTTFYVENLPCIATTIAVPFSPNPNAIAMNRPSVNSSVTTKVDRFYPFCKPTTKENSISDYLYLLWTGTSSINTPQNFTNLTKQEPGEFMKEGNVQGKMGSCHPFVYKNWFSIQNEKKPANLIENEKIHHLIETIPKSNLHLELNNINNKENQMKNDNNNIKDKDNDINDDERTNSDIVSTARTDLSITTESDDILITVDPTPDEISILHKDNTNKDNIKLDYKTHKAAGADNHLNPLNKEKDSNHNKILYKSVAQLPNGFLQSISTTSSVSMEADYLPKIINTNEPKSVGIIQPRKASSEWIQLGYDPWSAGKDLFHTELIKSLTFEEENIKTPDLITPLSTIIERQTASQTITKSAKQMEVLDNIMSLCRHGRYEELENVLNQPDWVPGIDTKDSTGNTLLSVAVQNNNKRVVKLTLRRGADVNTQNINGQTPLHYCYAYGFTELAEYLMEKGAKDDLLNVDGLTCYEGLTRETVDKI